MRRRPPPGISSEFSVGWKWAEKLGFSSNQNMTFLSDGAFSAIRSGRYPSKPQVRTGIGPGHVRRIYKRRKNENQRVALIYVGETADLLCILLVFGCFKLSSNLCVHTILNNWLVG